ncbi:PTS glucitol/sorbitol transporter subunit IIA [Tessaracoccus caeni]|uniref:PTS glucitol/sorbitol transporter subunit IIA n=1 Tax=Tessaracoccus caeni TaxID=3031239 RepID=UPI0023DB143B|nr:PTS glucitol/sorbitol transporter subunit IIA [Tessaracoccus caeni]MDF1489318.1 PTS glucitol/sorbitol transporter subunit IIA [Tessaracoccus caeni]
MSNTLWSTTASLVGSEAGGMIEAGVLILFGHPVPDALAEFSVVHEGASPLSRTLRPGDLFHFAGQTYTLDEVGDRACENLTALGHIVLYVNQPQQTLLPGAIKVTGPAYDTPAVGSTISFSEA